MADYFEHLSGAEVEEIKRIFYSQSYEIVETLQEALIELEGRPGDDALLKNIKRYIHTLKGDSNSIGLTSIGALCHRMEDVLATVIDRTGTQGRDAVDLLLECADAVGALLSESETGGRGSVPVTVAGKIEAFLSHDAGAPEAAKSSRVQYTEYQELQAQDAAEKGMNVFEVDILFHPLCREKSVAAFMLMQRLKSRGQVIRAVPDMESDDIDTAVQVSLLFSTGLAADAVIRDASIPGITSGVSVRDYLRPGRQGPGPEDGQEAGGKGITNQMLLIESSKVDRVMNLVGELIIGRSMVEHIARDAADGAGSGEIASRLLAANAYMERTVSDLQKGIMKMRMVPVNQVFRKFPKIVRDLAAEEQKKVRLVVVGRETELDKAIVDALGEPLAHIIRNMIAHGIETPELRSAAGKAEEGTITLKAFHEAAQIVIEAADDGRGIDTAALKLKAVADGHLSREDAGRLSDSDSLNLVFLPGLSTSATVTEISGRGVGMAAVKSAVEGLRGFLEIESTPEQGTTFRLRLPLTLAVIKAMLFEVGERLYALPIAAVSEVSRVHRDELVTVGGKDTLILRDRIISLIHLDGLLGTRSSEENRKFVLILERGGRSIGLVTDRLLGKQELVIKAIDSGHARSDHVSGASILGDGRIVLILDAPSLIRKAIENEKTRLAAL
ncbi:MAG: chemotaxis protein CheA [Thermodesulfovibrionales bacterium]